MPNDYNDGSRYRLPANLRQQVGLGRIGSDARDRGVVRSGLGIESIERALLYEVRTGESNYTGLSATTWTALDATNLTWDLTVSGKRPIEFHLSAWMTSDPTDLMGVSLTWDGVEVSNIPYGLAGIYNQSNVLQTSGFCVMSDPGPGTHTVQVVYKVSGGATGFVQVDAFTALVVMAKEV